MPINFEEIPSVIEVAVKPSQATRTVLEELNARQYLLKERSIKCENIKPFYAKIKKPPHRYYYKYICVCPRYNPKYVCKHAGNIVIDRDALTKKEHLYYLSSPKANCAAPRKMPRYFLKKAIISNCTARILHLAKPDPKRVTETLNNYSQILSRRQKRTLTKFLEKSTDIEYTTIQRALELLSEEKRLRKVAKRTEKRRCQNLSRKIARKQNRQIKKIIGLLFEEMKDFLLSDQFTTNESSTLEVVILEALRDFTDKDFNMTNNLREYQKILAFNLSIWINGFLANFYTNSAQTEKAPNYTEMPQTNKEKPTGAQQELTTFLPVGDYVLNSSDSEQSCYEEDEDYYSHHHQMASDRTLNNKSQ